MNYRKKTQGRHAGLIAVIIILAMTLSICLTSCNSDKTEKSDKDVSATESDTNTAEEEEEELSDDLTEENFGGADFRILYRNGCSRSNWAAYDVHRIEIWAEDGTEDVINDAVYKRNTEVESRFNVNIVGIAHPANSTSEDSVASYVKKATTAGTNEFDIVVSYSTHLANLAADGLFIDWNSIPNINMSKPWWNQDAMKAYTVQGKSYMAMNDIIFPGVIGEAAFIMFNKNLITDLGLENPYTMVLENRWTLDTLGAVVKDCYTDVNGDGKKNMGDLYGFTSDAWGSAYAMMWAGGGHITATGSDGLPYYDLYTERNVSLFNKVYDLFYNNPGAAINSNKGTIQFQGDQATLFSSGNSVFLSDRVGVLCTPEYRNASFEFGILPMPKYDDTQDKYLTMINEHASVMAVPLFNQNLNMTGKIVEALSAQSRKLLVPAYYEVALKIKYSRDEESVQMLDLIFDGVVYDFGLLYNVPMFDIYQTFLLAKKDPSTFTSYIEANQEKTKKKLDAILELYGRIS